MDGVVADFDGYARKVVRSNPVDSKWKDEDWREISKNPRLYRDLEKTAEADILVEFCQDICSMYQFDLFFLTAVPRGNDMPWAFHDKMVWVQKYFPTIPLRFGPYAKDKWQHCCLRDILIDDRPSNILEWNNAGGHGILHQGNIDQTLKTLSFYIL